MVHKTYDLSPSEAARYLGIHVDTLKRWADDGKVTCWVTPTGNRRFAIEDLQAILPAASETA